MNKPPRFLIMVTMTILIFIAATAILIAYGQPIAKQIESNE